MPQIQLIARHTTKPGREEEVLDLVGRLVEAARREPGNVAFDIYRKVGDDRSYVLLERYASREALADHRATAHFQDLVIDRIVPLLASRTIEEHDVPEDPS